LKAERLQFEQRLAAGSVLLSQRQQKEAAATLEAEADMLRVQLKGVLASAGSPDETTRQMCAQSIGVYLSFVGEETSSSTIDAIASCLCTLLDSEISAAVRSEAASTFQMFEACWPSRAATLVSQQLSESGRSQLIALLSACPSSLHAPSSQVLNAPSDSRCCAPSIPASSSSQGASMSHDQSKRSSKNTLEFLVPAPKAKRLRPTEPAPET
jgi:hypothetical protein